MDVLQWKNIYVAWTVCAMEWDGGIFKNKASFNRESPGMDFGMEGLGWKWTL